MCVCTGPGKPATLSVPVGHTAVVAVLNGAVRINGSRSAGAAELVLLDTDGTQLQLEVASDSMLLVLTGAPLDEPIVGYGPFVANAFRPAEIDTALKDFQRGKFGRMPDPDITQPSVHAKEVSQSIAG